MFQPAFEPASRGCLSTGFWNLVTFFCLHSEWLVCILPVLTFAVHYYILILWTPAYLSLRYWYFHSVNNYALQSVCVKPPRVIQYVCNWVMTWPGLSLLAMCHLGRQPLSGHNIKKPWSDMILTSLQYCMSVEGKDAQMCYVSFDPVHYVVDIPRHECISCFSRANTEFTCFFCGRTGLPSSEILYSGERQHITCCTYNLSTSVTEGQLILRIMHL